MIGTLRALAATLAKMFIADLGLTLGALLAVGLCAAGVAARWLPAADAPFLLAAGALAALALGVTRGAAVGPRLRRLSSKGKDERP